LHLGRTYTEAAYPVAKGVPLDTLPNAEPNNNLHRWIQQQRSFLVETQLTMTAGPSGDLCHRLEIALNELEKRLPPETLA